MALLGCIPFLFWAAATGRLLARGTHQLRESIAIAAVAMWFWSAVGAELLSLIRALALWPVLLWWSVPLLALGWNFPRQKMSGRRIFAIDRIVLVLAGLTALILVATFLAAALTPPTNWDSLSYHLPRQVYWIQQKQVAFFPTHDWRMLTMPPAAEYLGVQLMLLAGGDSWLNLVQWFSLAVCAITVSLIVHELGGNARAQACGALLAVSIPTAALQATSTKNDVVTAFLLCALGWVGLRVFGRKQYRLSDALLAGATGGLLLLSKATGAIMGLPLLLWIGWTCFRCSANANEFLRRSSLGAAVALLLVAGHFSRVYTEFGSITGPRVSRRGFSLQNTLHTPGAFASNLLRNTGMHLATPNAALNNWVTDRVRAAHAWIGIEPDDPRTTFGRSQEFQVKLDLLDEDRAKAPVHVVLTLAAFGVLLFRTMRRPFERPGLFLWTPYLGFALFCFLVAWQEWHSRLHIPLLCLGSAVVAHVLGTRFPRTTMALAGIAAGIALYGVTSNQAKPFFGSQNIFRTSKKEMRYRPAEARDALKQALAECQKLNPRVIGMIANRWEYTPLRQLLNGLPERPRFVKVNAAYANRDQPVPEVVITWLVEGQLFESQPMAGSYVPVLRTGQISVYARKSTEGL